MTDSECVRELSRLCIHHTCPLLHTHISAPHMSPQAVHSKKRQTRRVVVCVQESARVRSQTHTHTPNSRTGGISNRPPHPMTRQGTLLGAQKNTHTHIHREGEGAGGKCCRNKSARHLPTFHRACVHTTHTRVLLAPTLWHTDRHTHRCVRALTPCATACGCAWAVKEVPHSKCVVETSA